MKLTAVACLWYKSHLRLLAKHSQSMSWNWWSVRLCFCCMWMCESKYCVFCMLHTFEKNVKNWYITCCIPETLANSFDHSFFSCSVPIPIESPWHKLSNTLIIVCQFLPEAEIFWELEHRQKTSHWFLHPSLYQHNGWLNRFSFSTEKLSTYRLKLTLWC